MLLARGSSANIGIGAERLGGTQDDYGLDTRTDMLMSHMGQTRRFGDVRHMSG